MKVIPKEERCAEPRLPNWSGWTYTQCSRRGTITEEDKIWCWQHAPSSVKKRQAESAARYKADNDRRMAPYHELDRLRAVNAKLLKALESAEFLFGSVRIQLVAEDYDQASAAASKGESLCCEAIEEARE